MVTLMKVCNKCSRYTLENSCPNCGNGSQSAHPAKYSKEDRYGAYRRKALYPGFFKS